MLSNRLLFIGSLLALSYSPAAAITINLVDVSYAEDFNSLATATGSIMPASWVFAETGSAANATYGAGSGSSTTGNTYSFGASDDSERALGALRTASLVSSWGTEIVNQTGSVITQLDLQYFGERWRLGATGRTDQLDFAYSVDATSLTTGLWSDFNSLDFVAPANAGPTGALDGNAAGNRFLVAGSLSGLNLAPGASLWLRWSDIEATGSDDGLAIDDFAIVARQAPAQAIPVPEGLPLPASIAAIGAVLLAGRLSNRARSSAQKQRLPLARD